jgi:hypothetical protein
MRANWLLISRAHRAKVSSASSAHSRWRERSTGLPISSEANSQACLLSSTMSGDSAGGRALPVCIRSSERLRSAVSRPGSIV